MDCVGWTSDRWSGLICLKDVGQKSFTIHETLDTLFICTIKY